MGRLCTPGPNLDPATTVFGSTPFNCPDIRTIDLHLLGLIARIEKAHALPRLVEIYRADMDLLLDRRSYLEACA